MTHATVSLPQAAIPALLLGALLVLGGAQGAPDGTGSVGTGLTESEENARPTITTFSVTYEDPIEACGDDLQDVLGLCDRVQVEVTANDSDGDIQEIVVDWGDGTDSVEEESDALSASHAYSLMDEARWYTIRVEAYDDEGALAFDEERVKVYRPFSMAGPIYIDGDDENLDLEAWSETPFVREEGGTYYIEDLRIPTAGIVSGATWVHRDSRLGAISLQNTEKPVVIENVYIHPPPPSSTCRPEAPIVTGAGTSCFGADVGIDILDSEHVTIQDVIVDGQGRTPLATGISIGDSSEVDVEGANIRMTANTELIVVLQVPFLKPSPVQGSWGVQVEGASNVRLSNLEVTARTCASGVGVEGGAEGVAISSSIFRVFPGVLSPGSQASGGCRDDPSPQPLESGSDEAGSTAIGAGLGVRVSASGTEADPIRIYDNMFNVAFQQDIGRNGHRSMPAEVDEASQVEWAEDPPDQDRRNILDGPCVGGNYWVAEDWAGIPDDAATVDGPCAGAFIAQSASDFFGSINDPYPLSIWAASFPQPPTFETHNHTLQEGRVSMPGVIMEEDAWKGTPLVAYPCDVGCQPDDEHLAVFDDAIASVIGGHIVEWDFTHERNETFEDAWLTQESPSPEAKQYNETRLDDPRWVTPFPSSGVYDVSLVAETEGIRHNLTGGERVQSAASAPVTEQVLVASPPIATFMPHTTSSCTSVTGEVWEYECSTTIKLDAAQATDGDGLPWAMGFGLVHYGWEVRNETTSDVVASRDCIATQVVEGAILDGNGQACETPEFNLRDRISGDYRIVLNVTDRFGLQSSTSIPIFLDAAGLDPDLATLDGKDGSSKSVFATWETVTIRDTTQGSDTANRTVTIDGLGGDTVYECSELNYRRLSDDGAPCGEYLTHVYPRVEPDGGTSQEFSIQVDLDLGDDEIRSKATTITVENREPPAFVHVEDPGSAGTLLAEDPAASPFPASNVADLSGADLLTRHDLTFVGPAPRQDGSSLVPDSAAVSNPLGEVDGEIRRWEWTIDAPDREAWVEHVACLTDDVGGGCDEVLDEEASFDAHEPVRFDAGRLDLRGGWYTVRLSTVDDLGAMSTGEVMFFVDWSIPEVDVTCSWEDQDGQDQTCSQGGGEEAIRPSTLDEVTFHAAVGLVEEDNDFLIEWFIDGIEDGKEPAVSGFATLVYQFDEVRPYTVDLLVLPESGEPYLNTTTVTVDVQNVPPDADFIVEPSRPTAGAPVRVTDTSSDVDGTIEKRHWDFGDGDSHTCSNDCPDDNAFTHTYDGTGTYDITLTTTDNGNGTGTQTRTILVEPPDPDASFHPAPLSPRTQQAVTFTDTSSPSGYADIVERSWRFGDGTTHTCTARTPCNATHTYDTSGAYPVTLSLTDTEGRQDSVTQTIQVQNQPPRVTANATPNPVQIDEDVHFESDIHDPDGSIEATQWDLGDGSISSEPRPVHSYTAKGVYDVTLVVTDDVGATNETTFEVHVANQPPTTRFLHEPDRPATGQAVTFEADAEDPDGTIVDHAWGFGDGHEAGGANATHAFQTPGTYNITLTTTDDDGATAHGWVHLDVTNRPPTPAFTSSPDTPTAREDVVFISQGEDPDGSIALQEWRIDGEPQASGSTFTHRFPSAGTYNVTLTLTDDLGATNHTTRSITVTNAPPAPAFTIEPDSPSAHETIRFTDASADPDGTIQSTHWDFGDGNTSTDPNPAHTYTTPGTYMVGLTVTDDDGTQANAYDRVRVLSGANAYDQVGVLSDAAEIARQDQDTFEKTEAPGLGVAEILLALAASLALTIRSRWLP